LAQSPQEQETTITVERGLFVLRYASGAGVHRSPVAMVRPAPASAPYVEVMSAPGVVAGFLSSPGDCAVVRAEQSGKLMVRIMAQHTGDPLDATFKLEPLGGAERQNSDKTAGAPAATNDDALTILAHVSRRGDVEVTAGAWIAGPDAPAPIEGLEVRGALPADLSLEIQPLLATNPPRWLDWVGAGNFVGTRQRALPLAGLRLRLSGSASEEFALSADALFLGSPIMNRRGRDIELTSAAGGDPLVGLRIELLSFETASRTERAAEPYSPPLQKKLRVFRASAG
jgi:hypothetical protein